MGYLQGLVKVTAVFNALGEVGNMTQHFFSSSPTLLLDATQRAALASHYDVWWETGPAAGGSTQKSAHPTVVTFSEIAITEYTSGTGNGAPITNRNETGGPGTAGTGVLPPEVSICISKRTAGSGARARGRTYLPFLSSGFLQASRFDITAANAGIFANNYSELLDDINADVTIPLNAVVFSFAGTTTGAITSVAVGTQWDTQRRRGNALVEAYTSSAVTPQA